MLPCTRPIFLKSSISHAPRNEEANGVAQRQEAVNVRIRVLGSRVDLWVRDADGVDNNVVHRQQRLTN